MMLDTGGRRKAIEEEAEDEINIDLSCVKKEEELEDYGHNTGNILDNFVNEHDYEDFPQNPCGEDGSVDVDWLSSFFDEPLHSNMTGLNPALCDINSSSHFTSPVHRVTSINCNSDNLLLDTFSPYSEDFSHCPDSTLKSPCTPHSPSIRNNNPLLSQADVDMVSRCVDMTPKCVEETLKCSDITSTEDIVMAPKSPKIELDIKDEPEEKMVNSPVAMEVDKQTVQKAEKQNQQKLLLFMNTAENRAKLAGTNYNIINANLLSKLSGQNFQKTDAAGNVINLKNCLKLNNVLKQESAVPTQLKSNFVSNCENVVFTTDRNCGKILLRRDRVNTISTNLQTSLSQTLAKHEKDNQAIDSGYESPGHSSNSSPGSPQIDVESNDGTNFMETIHHVDVPPHERQPFFLSPEERRTLIAEGLPVPQGLPLSKVEERALKKVRRKIKNKISAQESRRKKKEYMEALEKKVDNFSAENGSLKKKITTLEVANRSLIIQVQRLQALVSSKVKQTATSAVQTDGIL